MKLQTITTIELSSICNLSCKYCINRLMVKNGRTPSIMTDDTFDASLRWLRALCDLETQQEVNLNGNGESTLDPKLVYRARRVKDIMGERSVQFCTNALLLTKKLIYDLKDAGVDRIDLSIHSAYNVRRCVGLLADAQMPSVVNAGTVMSSHNWAGQLEKEHEVDICYTIPCHPIIQGRGYIDSDGYVTPCCYDYLRLGAFGTVFNVDLLDREVKPFSLCKTCHQTLPGGENAYPNN